MATDYPVKLEIRLRPIWHNLPPEINIGIDNNTEKVTLSTDQTFCFDFTASDTATLTVELLNKTDADTVPDKGLDKAVVIESIGFFGIADPRFVWAGVYEPVYPEPWATEQRNHGVVLQPQLTNQTYLAWNGKWTLTFTIPVFTWIHGVQNLGWIYD
jgi:hypothetical protein